MKNLRKALPIGRAHDSDGDRLRWISGLLFFEQGLLDRAHISSLLGVFDRRHISQLIDESIDRGWVRLSCLPPIASSLSTQLCDSFDLLGCEVIAAPPDGGGLERVIGGAAARYLVHRLDKVARRKRSAGSRDIHLGVSGGTTMREMVEALGSLDDEWTFGGSDSGFVDERAFLRGDDGLRFHIVPVSRSEPPSQNENTLWLSGGELAGMLSDRFVQILQAAAGVEAIDRVASRESFRFLAPGVSNVLAQHPRLSSQDVIDELDIVVTGLGGERSKSLERIKKLLGPEAAGLRGEMFGLPLDRDLAASMSPADASSLTFEKLNTLMRERGNSPPADVVAAAAGEDKVGALLAALGCRRLPEGRSTSAYARVERPLVNHVVTSIDTACAVLEAVGEDPENARREFERTQRDDRRLWLAGYLFFVHEPRGDRSRIIERLRKEGLSESSPSKTGNVSSSQRVETAELVRRAARQSGRPMILVRSHAPRSVRLEARLTQLFRLEVRVASGAGPTAAGALAAEVLQGDLTQRRALLEKFNERENRTGPAGAPYQLRIGIAGGHGLQQMLAAYAGDDFLSEWSPIVRIYPLVCRRAFSDRRGYSLRLPDSLLADILMERLRGSRSCEILRYEPEDLDELNDIKRLDYVREFLEEAQSLDVALLGIGRAHGKDMGRWEGLEQDPSEIVADVCGQPLAKDGSIVRFGAPHLLGIELEALGAMFVESEHERWRRAQRQSVDAAQQIRRFHRLMGVASGDEKTAAVLSVLRRNLDYAQPIRHLSQAPKPDRMNLDPASAPLLNTLVIDLPLAEGLAMASKNLA